ncbi:hypothetical protein EDB86DRAFT_2280937 [Lactarius hatsudake]|nr:hypothetical protein EDB86DRAFT_2280937 [Lactarius hatsudake]
MSHLFLTSRSRSDILLATLLLCYLHPNNLPPFSPSHFRLPALRSVVSCRHSHIIGARCVGTADKTRHMAVQCLTVQCRMLGAQLFFDQYICMHVHCRQVDRRAYISFLIAMKKRKGRPVK